MTNLIDERDERTKRRKKDKAEWDSEIDLSLKQDKKMLSVTKELSTSTIRLLDEGAIVGDGFLDFFIKRGTLEKYLNGENEYLDNLPEDFIGSVNLGHFDFATFPFIIGDFTKDDLSLVDIGDNRQGLDVKLNLDDESVFVKELARQPYDIAISSEFYYHADEEASEEYGFLVIDEVLITAYALVGEPGNVNSDGLELGGQEMNDEKMTEVLDEQIEEIAEEEKAEETIEATEEEVIEEVAEEVEDEVEAVDEVEESEVEETIEEDSEEDKAEENLESVAEAFEELQKENEELKEKCEALKKDNRSLQKKLKTKNEEIEKFTNKFKGLSVSLGLKEEKEEVKQEALYKGSNGIGEL